MNRPMLRVTKAQKRKARQRLTAKAPQVWVETPLNDDWMAAYRLVSQPAGPVVAELRVFPRERGKDRPPGMWTVEVLGVNALVPLGGLPSELLRQVRLTDYREFAAEFGRWLVENATATASEQKQVIPRNKKKVLDRRGRSDRFYAAVAKEYVDLWTRGIHQPIITMARRRSTSKSKIRDMVRQARQRGLLTTGQRGRIGGQLTASALAVLSNEHSD